MGKQVEVEQGSGPEIEWMDSPLLSKETIDMARAIRNLSSPPTEFAEPSPVNYDAYLASKNANRRKKGLGRTILQGKMGTGVRGKKKEFELLSAW